jgi:acyl-CoA reductase-like NAD-dependent aldehyde dehydrogenase
MGRRRSYAPNINPSNLSAAIGEYAQADAAQVETAVAAAKAPSGVVHGWRAGAQRCT